MPSLSIMIKPSSGNCNMTCDYCFYCDEMSKREQSLYGFMSDETLKNVIRKTMPHSDYQITYAFQGESPRCGESTFSEKPWLISASITTGG